MEKSERHTMKPQGGVSLVGLTLKEAVIVYKQLLKTGLLFNDRKECCKPFYILL